jgi:hypothetical protein
MRKTICVILCPVIFFAGCMGRESKPVPLYISGDENLSCESLKSDVVYLQKKMASLLPQTDKFGTNTLWACYGVATLGVGFVFMDLAKAEKAEFEAARLRHNKLLEYLKAKNCDVNDIRAEPVPSLEKQKKEAEEAIKKQKDNTSNTTQNQDTQQATGK